MAAIDKFQDGTGYMVGMFAETWIPKFMVSFQASTIQYTEAFIAIWLLVGFRLRLAWVFTGLVLASLTFGMAALGKHDVVGSNINYIIIVCAGIFFSQYDCLSVDGFKEKRCCCPTKSCNTD